MNLQIMATEKQVAKAKKYALIWLAVWGIKIFLIGGSPALLLVSTIIVYFVVRSMK